MEKKTTQTKKKETAAAASSSAIRAEKEAAVKAYKKAAKERTPQMPQQTRTPQNVRQEMQSIVDRASGRMQPAMNAQQETGKQEIQRTMQDIVSRATASMQGKPQIVAPQGQQQTINARGYTMADGSQRGTPNYFADEPGGHIMDYSYTRQDVQDILADAQQAEENAKENYRRLASEYAGVWSDEVDQAYNAWQKAKQETESWRATNEKIGYQELLSGTKTDLSKVGELLQAQDAAHMGVASMNLVDDKQGLQRAKAEEQYYTAQLNAVREQLRKEGYNDTAIDAIFEQQRRAANEQRSQENRQAMAERAETNTEGDNKFLNTLARGENLLMNASVGLYGAGAGYVDMLGQRVFGGIDPVTGERRAIDYNSEAQQGYWMNRGTSEGQQEKEINRYGDIGNGLADKLRYRTDEGGNITYMVSDEMLELIAQSKQQEAMGRVSLGEAMMGGNTEAEGQQMIMAARGTQALIRKELEANGYSEKEIDAIFRSTSEAGRVADAAYQGTVSMLQSAQTAALTAVGVPEAVGLVMMSMPAATQTAQEYHEQGYSDGTALLMGAIAGTAEYATEKMSIDALFKARDARTVKNMLKATVLNLNGQGLSEMGEEITSSAINLAADMIVNGDRAMMYKSVPDYMEQGMTEEQAKQEAFKDWFMGELPGWITSYFTGVIMGGGSMAIQSAANARNNRAQGQQIIDNKQAEALRSMAEKIDAQDADIFGVNREADTGNAKDVGNLNRDALLARDAAEIREALEKNGETATPELVRAVWAKTNEQRLTKEEARAWRESKNAHLAVEQIRQNNEGKMKAAEVVARMTGKDAAAIMEEFNQADMQERWGEKNTDTEGNTDGRNEMADENGERVDTFRAGEQSEGSAESRSEQKTEQQRKAGERRDSAQDLRKVSSASIVEGGAAAETISVMPVESWDDEMRSAAEGYRQRTGKSVTYVVGELMGEDDEGTFLANGCITADGDIVVRADSDELTVQQIMDHEDFHSRESEEMRATAVEKIKAKYSEEEFAEVVAQYQKNLPGYSMEEIISEILADAYAGINAWDVNAGSYQEQVRETVAEHEGKQENGSRQTNGPNKTRYSYAGEKSKTADKASLEKARELDKSGTDNETIRRETGWFKGADGLWRYEIDDSGAVYRASGDAQARESSNDYVKYMELERAFLEGTLTQEDFAVLRKLDEQWRGERARLAYNLNNGEATLADIMQHGALFEAYPEIAKTKIEFANLPEGTRGAYVPSRDVIQLNESLRNNQDQIMSTLLHEVQHRIQSEEGFANGANPGYWNKDPQYSRAAQQYKDNLNRIYWKLSREERAMLDEYRQTSKQLDDYISGESTMSLEESDRLEERNDELYEELYKKDWFAKMLRYERVLENAGVAINEFYWNTAGEIEARDTANRKGMTAEERKNAAPNTGGEDTVFADGQNRSEAETSEDRETRWSRTERKEAQYEEIVKANPMRDDIHAGIRSAEDILTFEEALVEDGLEGEDIAPDFTAEMAQEAIDSGKITVYSSKDIKTGSFVTPSKMEAKSYAGSGSIRSMEVSLDDVAWLDSIQGQYAPVGTKWSRTEQRGKLSENEKNVFGKTGTTITGRRTRVKFTYAVVSIEELGTSHDPDGTVNENYPQELQPRDRSRVGSISETQAMSNAIVPELLEESMTAQNGAPIVTEDGNVIGGNKRVNALTLAYRNGRAVEYEQYLRDNAAKWGIDADAIPGNPVLVRVTDHENAVSLARELNEQTTEASSATEAAKTDAERLTDDILRLLDTGEDDGADLNSKDNSAFIQAFIETLPESERAALITKNGKLNQAGITRARNALIAKAYGDDARLAKIAEDIDPDAKNILNALAAAAPMAAKAQTENESGINPAEMILKAIDIYEEAKSAGMTMQEFFDQGNMIEEWNGMSAVVAKFIEKNKRSGKKIREMFEAMNEAMLEYDPNQTSIFSDEVFDYVTRIEEVYERRTGRNLGDDLGNSVSNAYSEGQSEENRNGVDGRNADEDAEKGRGSAVTKDQGAEMTEGLFVNQEAKEEQAAEPADEEKTAGSWDDAVNEATEWAAPHEQQITEDAEANTEEPAAEVTGEDIDEENRRRLEAMFGTLPDEDAQTQEVVDRMAEELGDGLADIAAGQSPVQTEAGREKISAKTEEEKQSWKQRARKAWDAFKRSMVNQADSIHQMALKLKDPSMDGYFFYAKAHRQRANDWVTKKRTSYNGNKVGKSLNEIMNPIREKGDDYYTSFQSYMYHMLNVDRFAASNQEEVRTTQAALDMFVRAHPNIAAMTDERLRALERTLDDVLVPDESMQDAVLAREYLQLRKERDIAANRSFKPVLGYEVSGADSEEAAKKLLVDHPEFEQLAQEVYDYIDDLLQFRVDSGLITENDKKTLQEKYPHYVPAYYDTEQNDSSSWNGNANVSKTIRRAKGGNQKLKPLHTSLAQQTGSVMFNSGIEKLATKILDQYEANRGAMEQYVQEVKEMPHYWDADDADKDIDVPNSNVISVIRDGKRYEVTLDEGTAAAFRQLTEKDSELRALNFMKNINDTFKKLCTAWNPLFMITNPLRDVQDALFYSTDTKNWAKNYAKTVSEIANNGEYWTMYSAMGGIGSSIFDWMTGETEKETGGIMGKVEAVNLYIEQMPRLAEFMTVLENAKKNHGEITEDDRMNAFNAAQEITTNFGRTGKYGSIINKYFVPFWNPSVQGMSKAVRTIAETKGAKAWVNLTFKAAALGILPSIINGMLYRKDDEWDKIKDSDKINYYLFKGKDGVWVKIPKGRVLAALSAGAVGLQEFARGDDVDWVEIGKAAVEEIAPNNPFENNIVSQMMRTDLFDPDSPGKTWYGSDIESQRLRKLSPGERYDESTDVISKWLGKQLNLSPKKINYLIDQYSGVLGDVILPYLTPKAERGVYIPVTKDVEIAVPLSNAFLSRFTIDTVSNNKISGEYYDMADELTYAKNDGSVSGTVASQYMSHAGGAISDIYSQIREIENDPNLTNREKTELTRELRGVLNEQQMDIMANADRYRQVAEQFLQAYPELDYSSKEAVQAWMDSYNAKQSGEQYYIDAEKATTKMKEELYREVNRITFGAEYALQTYNKDVYYKALELNQTAELSFDDYYQYYFASQYIYADKDENGNSISGSKKQKMVGLIDSMAVTNAQKDALFLAAGYGESTLGSTPWHGGEGVYVEEGGSGNGGGGNGGRRRRRGGGGGRSSGSATLRSLPGITGAAKGGKSSGSTSSGAEMLRALFSGSSAESDLKNIYKAVDRGNVKWNNPKRNTTAKSNVRSGESAVQRYLRTGKL